MWGINLSSIIVPFLTGGVMGAIITQICTIIRNRVQPVGYKVEILPLFKKNIKKSTVITNVSITEDGHPYNFENLFIINVSVSNSGNKDFDKFKFAITCSNDDKIIAIEQSPIDTFHRAKIQDDISPSDPLGQVIIELEPFNRKNTYDFRLYVTISAKNEEPGEIKFSSPASVRFTPMPSFGKVSVSVGKVVLGVTANKLGVDILSLKK